MEKSTEAPPSQDPPAFMRKVEDEKSKAQRTVEREEKAQERDEVEKRAADIVKATGRLHELAEYMGKIDKVIAATLPSFITGNPLGQTIDLFVDLEDMAKEVEDQVKRVMGRLATAREVHFPARLDSEDTKTTTSKDTGHRMTRTARIFASIITDAKEKAFQWLRNNDYGSLIQETVNSSSLSSAAKELMENGKELPDDLFRTHTKDSVSITRGKPAKENKS